jgi:hypothetical protein
VPACVGRNEERMIAMKGRRPKSKVVGARLSVGLMEVYISNLEKNHICKPLQREPARGNGIEAKSIMVAMGRWWRRSCNGVIWRKTKQQQHKKERERVLEAC